MLPDRSPSMNRFCRMALAMSLALCAVLTAAPAPAQEVDPALLQEAARRTGKTPEQLLQEYRQAQGQQAPAAAADTAAAPGRTNLQGIDDRRTRSGQDTTGGQFGVVLPLSGAAAPIYVDADSAAADSSAGGPVWFGQDFFRLDQGMFEPPSFGPVPEDYRLGVGDEVIVDVWGEVEMRLSRLVDRDGTIILPQAGQITCAGRTLAQVDQTIREKLRRSHASLGRTPDDPNAKTYLQVTLGKLRPIRVFVVGEAARPGSYEVNSVSSVLTALYAAGGPSAAGSLRHIRLVRGGETVGELDLYAYLLGGDRSGDLRLREGDTVHVPERTFGVSINGAVRRPMHYEMREGEGVAELVRYAGGLTARAAADVLHVQRILPPDRAPRGRARPGGAGRALRRVHRPAPRPGHRPPARRRPGGRGRHRRPHRPLGGGARPVKRPGRYELRDGMTVADLVTDAGGLWPDALTDWAALDRTSPARDYSTVTVPLDRRPGRRVGAVSRCRPATCCTCSAAATSASGPRVSISGEVHQPLTMDYRQGMTLRDLVLRAGGLKHGANLLRAEIARIREAAVAEPRHQRAPDPDGGRDPRGTGRRLPDRPRRRRP